jgi:hypothetical protein
MNVKAYFRIPFFLVSVPLLIAITLATIAPAHAASGKNMMDFFLPMPMFQDRLESTGVWGVKNVVPRDIYNGLEDSSCKKYAYWDGAIIKGKDGKYHLYCSRWDQSAGHNGWNGSVAVLAVSDSIMGPYIEKGLAYTKDGGKGHNVTAITLPDGRIAIIVCETVPFEVFVASDPNGPFEYQGSPQINTNGHNIGGAKLASNMSICMREDSTFLIVTRDGFILHSTNGIMGPYLVKTDKIWPMNLAGYNTANWEDPVIWRSGKKYYCTVNSWSSKKAIYLTSDDGLTNWKYTGEAYSPLNQNMLWYTNGKKNIWCKMERPGVYVENGVVKYLTWAVIDTEKEADKGNDNHNSKIIVVPFDGWGFDGITAVQAGEMRRGPKQAVSLVVENSGKTVKIISSGALNCATRLDIGVYNVNGRLVDRMSNVTVSGGSFVLNHGNSGSRLSSGAYLVTLRYGKQTVSVPMTIQ